MENNELFNLESKADLRVLSLGAGVQSTTMALMCNEGLIPKPDCAIFIDFSNLEDLGQIKFGFMDECDGMCGV